MFANFLIGLREGLEAALVVGIIVAYLRRTGHADLLRGVWTGVAVAIAASLGFGALLTFGQRDLGFAAQERLGGLLSLAAVGFVTWMVLWMARTARNLKGELEGRLGDAIVGGRRYALVLVAMLAVGREGLETALFLWAAARATGSSTSPLAGAVLGLLLAVVIGAAVTRGALRLNLGRFFTWTGAALVIVAAGVLAYGIHDLQEAGTLPGLHRLAFDVSSTIRPGTWYATLLKGTVNFTPETTWLQAIAWVAYVVVVLPLFFLTVRRGHAAGRGARAGAPTRPAGGELAPNGGAA